MRPTSGTYPPSALRSLRFRALGAIAFALLLARLSWAGSVILQVQAGNPIDKPQTVRIRTNLPAMVGTNEIVNLDGLELGYDVRNQIFYVHKELELGPRQIEVFRVELKDIWIVPDATLRELEEHTDQLAEKLQRTEHEPTATATREQIFDSIQSIRKLQDDNKIRSGVDAVRHIRAFETNQHELELVRKYIGRLENLVLSTGQDTQLLGGYKASARPRRDVEMSRDEYKTAIYRITVRNTSPDMAHDVPVRRELPPEITVNDILDPGGLSVERDDKTGVCTVFADKVTLGPNESRTFEIKIHDKWNVNQYRFTALRQYGEDVLGRVANLGKFDGVENTLRELLAQLDGIEQEDMPKALDDKYVAFFREQASRLDLIEQKINRIESALRPMKKPPEWGFPVKPPTVRTTWLIIYIILGFLMILSLLFFLRWYGGSGSGSGTP